jgi:hypothetical protein
MIALLPLQGELYAAVTTLQSATVGSQGTLGAVSTLDVKVRNSADDSINSTGLGFNAAGGSTVTTSPQYLDVTFNDNSVGFQAITISTDNRTAKNVDLNGDGDTSDAGETGFKYNGPAQGSGMVGVTDKTVTVPLLWVIFDALKTNTAGVNGGKGYAFNVPLKTDREYFIQDKRQGEAAECKDSATGAFESGAACDADDPIVDWDGDGVKGAKAYDAGFASALFGIAGTGSSMAKAPEDKNPTVDDDSNAATPVEIDGPNRETADGNVKMYLATNYTGADAQQFFTGSLTLELVTIS